MKPKLVCLPSEDVKRLIWRFDNFLVEQELELKYQRKNLDEIKKLLKVYK
jgi:hypothetical protein